MSEVVKVVDTGGTGDYASLNAALSDNQQNLVTADTQLTFKCQTTNGNADTAAVTVTGYTTDSARYIKIWTDPSESYRHAGKWTDTAYRLQASIDWNAFLTVNNNDVKIDGIQINNTSGSNPDGIEYDGGGEFDVSNCILKGHRWGFDLDTTNDCTIRLWNNIVYDFSGVGIRSQRASDLTTIVCYNNTLYSGSGTGIYFQNLSYLYLKNNLVQNGATAMDNNYILISIGSQTTATNIAEDTTSPDDTFDSKTVAFLDEDNDDFHLDSTDTEAIGNGTDLSTDASSMLSFSTDIDGDTRSSWDIGADEYVSSGGTNMKINIADTFKNVSSVKSNVGDLWKTVISIKQNISDTWKSVF